MFKVNNKDNNDNVFIVNFKHISPLVLNFLWLTWNMYLVSIHQNLFCLFCFLGFFILFHFCIFIFNTLIREKRPSRGLIVNCTRNIFVESNQVLPLIRINCCINKKFLRLQLTLALYIHFCLYNHFYFAFICVFASFSRNLSQRKLMKAMHLSL